MTRGVLKRCHKHRRAGSLSAGNLFGAQSRWSSLLVERERLESEIKHAELFLEQLRKDVAGPKVPFSPHLSGPAGQGSDKHSLERYVLAWLGGLQERLNHVSAEVDILMTQGEPRAECPEESLFTLLRSAR
jgi:hypothetical protein